MAKLGIGKLLRDILSGVFIAFLINLLLMFLGLVSEIDLTAIALIALLIFLYDVFAFKEIIFARLVALARIR